MKKYLIKMVIVKKLLIKKLINPKVIIHPKSIIGFIPLKIKDKKAQIVVKHSIKNW